jgi:uncharacterized protein (DUF1800 family)
MKLPTNFSAAMPSLNLRKNKLLIAVVVAVAACALSAFTQEASAQNPKPRYRLYSPVTLAHLYTSDLNEYNVLATRGWSQENLAHRCLDTSGSYAGVSLIPYYRIYNSTTRWHHWTADPLEHATMRAIPGNSSDGVDCYILSQAAAPSANTLPLYVLYFPPLNKFLWTTDENEKNVLTSSRGWVYVRIDGHVLAPPNVTVPPASMTLNDASRLLTQTTFGATQAEITRVANLGASAYLTEQINIPQSLYLPQVRANADYPERSWAVMSGLLWKQYFEANDQLRQRVVNALSQILVISLNQNTLLDQPCATGAYLDTLGRHAFGNFRDILRDVTMSPAMGDYLDMKQSGKADAVLNSIPNENYARELLQLFSIGTVMLNIDGTTQLVNGKTVETYSEATAQNLARALTGWTFAGQDQTKSWRWLYPDVPYPMDTASGEKACVAWSAPMQPWTAAYRSADDKRTITGPAHDTGAKSLLVYPGSANFKQNLPAGQTAEKDLEDAIDNVFNHPNVAPFITAQLIQRLVTSNPTGGYVRRVATVFNNNGSGVRGDMKAVITAILLDEEARLPLEKQPNFFGKVREPIMRFTQAHRAFGGKMAGGSYSSIWDLGGSDAIGQSPLRAPSVFNFYHPDFAPTGPVEAAKLVGPEFEITNSATIGGFADFSKWGILGGFGAGDEASKRTNPNYSYYTSLSTNPLVMVEALNMTFMAGQMSAKFKSEMVDVATKLTDTNAANQARDRVYQVLWHILNSPEYTVQK